MPISDRHFADWHEPKRPQERVRVDGGRCPVAVLWVPRSQTNRPSKCLVGTRGELARKSLTRQRMSNDSPTNKVVLSARQ